MLARIHSFSLQGDTLRVIYAFGSTDPKGSDITDADYHGATNRGEQLKLNIWVTKFNISSFTKF